MSSGEATVKVFLTAFRALPRHEQNAFLFTIIKEHTFREDIMDLATAVKRSSEKCRSLRAFIGQSKRSLKS